MGHAKEATKRVPAEVFPPGEFLREELEARGWTQSDLAEILGRPFRMVNEIIAGKRAITPETAQGLGEALGTGAQFWMNLETMYRLHKVRRSDNDVAKRAHLFALAPIKEMVRRGWIESSKDVNTLEKRLKAFFEVQTLDAEPPSIPHAARQSVLYGAINPQLRAWLYRARKLARAVDAAPFSEDSLSVALEKLAKLLQNPEEARHVPRVLAEAGVRFIVLEHLSGTRIDGTCFWLDSNSPVVAISLRYDRIDSFWFTVAHELDHVKERVGLQDDQPVDLDLVGDQAQRTEDKPPVEQRADQFAAQFLIPKDELDFFIARVRPLYSKIRIVGFAKRIGVHPGIVVGQLARRGEISYAHSREMLGKVRDYVVSSALTDGWGRAVGV